MWIKTNIWNFKSNFSGASINEACFFNEQCETRLFQTECKDNVCACMFERTPVFHPDNTIECIGKWMIINVFIIIIEYMILQLML